MIFLCGHVGFKLNLPAAILLLWPRTLFSNAYDLLTHLSVAETKNLRQIYERGGGFI
jgi:hypothetical protein